MDRRRFLQRAAYAPLAWRGLTAALAARPLEQPDDWFAFTPGAGDEPDIIGMADWLDAPAGTHGAVRMDGGRFVFEDGTPAVFWGVNIASAKPYVGSEEAERWANYLARHGVNAVRFHKFTEAALTGPTSTRLADEKWARLDAFSARLREKGLYYGWSPIYGHRPRSGDRTRVRAYDEIAAVETTSHLAGSTSGLVNFADDLQALHIDLVVHMLEHRNPHTGLRYADDPALHFVELQNEDDIYWAYLDTVLEQTPTYQALLSRQFSDWLRATYGTHAALVEAWSRDALKDGEHLEKHNIDPEPNHGIFSHEYEQARKENRPIGQVFLDRARFLYERQIDFYDRFTEAVRAAGYRGPIVASCWQAGSGPTHYYNLFADEQTGFIDRHNYFGGGTGHRLTPGAVNPAPMVRAPGGSLLSTGMQQVSGRPFAFSEWMSKAPNEWTAEAAPLIAAYGLGLQGWDASYEYASNAPHLTETVEAPSHGVYNADAPTHMGLYPALARMLYRGDVQTGAVVSERTVHVPSLADGRLGFAEAVEQDADTKSFDGTVPPQALAVGRVVVAFTDTFKETSAPDLSPYWERDNQVIRSNTGQLAWHYGDGGNGEDAFVTIDTPGTKGVVGFAAGRRHTLGAVSLHIETPFAVVFVTSLGRERPVETAPRLLVTTVARARNTGMQYSDDGTRLLDTGRAPLRLEPVRLTVRVDRPGPPAVHVLSHGGRRTGRQVAARKDGTVWLDGAKHQAMYYELVYA